MSPKPVRGAQRRDTGIIPRLGAHGRPILLGVLLLFVALLLGGCNGDMPYEARYLLRELEPMLDELEPLLQAARWVFALAGLALLVAGYKIYRFVVALPGFLIGAVVGAGLGYAAGDENVLLAILGLVLGGLAGATLALLLHDLAVFLLGALIGGALAALLFAGLGDSGPPVLLVLVGAIIGGAGLLALSHLAIVVLSSFVGAVMFGFGIGAGPGWMLVFFLGGVAVQYGLARAIGDKIPRPGGKAKPRAEPAAPAPPVVTRKPSISAPMSPALPPLAALVSAGPGEGVYQVRNGSLVGWGEGCDIVLRDPTISRTHARFYYAEGDWFVQDEGSTSGTMVNGVLVMATRLHPGDRLQLGDAVFTFRCGGNR